MFVTDILSGNSSQAIVDWKSAFGVVVTKSVEFGPELSGRDRGYPVLRENSQALLMPPPPEPLNEVVHMFIADTLRQLLTDNLINLGDLGVISDDKDAFDER
ncbi:hypothetical protein D3230_06280 [Leucobacter chromiireducens subsp. solipictus]|uniref:Uncharacterized protein n=1 Tax=Leucobacter chromiireducens subsp. solipictus TaxID=398235 RepID=A0ABS1SFT3_9MICO|nr:hypothetical protein [Leucobacter chromiireducens subsp. solipictus]